MGRLASVISETDKYVVYTFGDHGPILDDVDGPPTHRKKVGGGIVGSGEETPFFAFDDAGI